MMTNQSDNIKRKVNMLSEILLDEPTVDHINWLIAKIERQKKHIAIVEKSFKQAKQDWHSACNDIDKLKKLIAKLRWALLRLDNMQGNTIYYCCRERKLSRSHDDDCSIQKAFAATETNDD